MQTFFGIVQESRPGLLAALVALHHSQLFGHVQGQGVFLGRTTAFGVFVRIYENLKVLVLIPRNGGINMIALADSGDRKG